jgi:hypothetical protein
MLIIFAIAALALLAAVGIVVILPIMLVAAVVRSRRRIQADAIPQATDQDSAFVELVSSQWPGEASRLRLGTSPK